MYHLRFADLCNVGRHVQDLEARVSILRVHTRAVPLAADIDLDSIAARTDRYTGAGLSSFISLTERVDLENVCREAALCALRRNLFDSLVSRLDFEYALKVVSASLTTAQLAHYESLRAAVEARS